MRFSPKQRKLKIDIVSSKFEQNRWRGSREIAKNVKAEEGKINAVFGLWQPCFGQDNHVTFVGTMLV